MPRPKTVHPVDLYPEWPDPCDLVSPDNVITSKWAHAETLRIVAYRMREEFRRRQWSLRVAAEHVGVNHVSLHNMMNGLVWPRAEHIAAIEIALDVQLWPTLAEVRDGMDCYLK